MIKSLGLRLLREAGYFVQKKSVMAYGIDQAMDIKRFSCGTDIKTIFDVGANVGQTASYYGANFPQAEIHSFEPIAGTFEKLVEACSDQPQFQLHKLALGSAEGFEEVELQSDSQWNSLAKPSGSTGQLERVEVTTLDAFLARESISRIDILKIDTEGYELEVLKGGQRYLATARNCFVVAESTFVKEDNSHTQFIDLLHYLYPFGFRFVGLYDQVYHYRSKPLPLLGYCNALFYKE